MKYTIVLAVNNEELSNETKNIKKGIVSLLPKEIVTSMILNIKDGEDVVYYKYFSLQEAKNFLNIKEHRDLILNNLPI
jgi:hypothetical protein